MYIAGLGGKILDLKASPIDGWLIRSMTKDDSLENVGFSERFQRMENEGIT